MVGGLSTVAVCAPSDKFLYMGGPLAMGLGVVFCASIASNFLPPTTALGAGMYSIAVYGGLVLVSKLQMFEFSSNCCSFSSQFGAFLLYDTQKVIHKAEHHPAHYGAPPFDPVNASIGIYMDTVNIFIRIAMMLASGGNRRKEMKIKCTVPTQHQPKPISSGKSLAFHAFANCRLSKFTSVSLYDRYFLVILYEI